MNLPSQIQGKVISLADDREHSRIVYIISVDEDGEPHLYGYT